MGRASGVLLVSAGLGLAAYVLFPANKPTAPSNDDFDLPLASKSALAGKTPTVAPTSLAVAPPQAAANGAASTASAPAVVTLSQYNRSSLRLAVGPQSKPHALATDRTQLARELQRELRRVGCYEGEINGGWTTSTKRAMKTFTERVNASLPVEEPDLVLLSLVQGQPDRVCGQPCPAGESATDAGRCIPTAVAASQRKPAHATAPAREATSPAIAGWSATAGAGASPTPPDGRAVLSGADGEDDSPATGGPLATPPSGLTHQPSVGAGYASQAREQRTATPIDRGPSRRFDAQSFFRRLDKQSAN